MDGISINSEAAGKLRAWICSIGKVNFEKGYTGNLLLIHNDTNLIKTIVPHALWDKYNVDTIVQNVTLSEKSMTESDFKTQTDLAGYFFPSTTIDITPKSMTEFQAFTEENPRYSSALAVYLAKCKMKEKRFEDFTLHNQSLQYLQIPQQPLFQSQSQSQSQSQPSKQQSMTFQPPHAHFSDPRYLPFTINPEAKPKYNPSQHLKSVSEFLSEYDSFEGTEKLFRILQQLPMIDAQQICATGQPSMERVRSVLIANYGDYVDYAEIIKNLKELYKKDLTEFKTELERVALNLESIVPRIELILHATASKNEMQQVASESWNYKQKIAAIRELRMKNNYHFVSSSNNDSHHKSNWKKKCSICMNNHNTEQCFENERRKNDEMQCFDSNSNSFYCLPTDEEAFKQESDSDSSYECNTNSNFISNHLYQPEMSSRPNEKVGFGFIQLQTTPRDHKHVLFAVDHYTGNVVAIPSKNDDSETAATFLRDHWIFRFGAPEFLVSDRGTDFVREVVKCICGWSEKQAFSSEYNPKICEQAEIQNDVIQNIKCIASLKDEKDWDILLPGTIWKYNSTPSTSTNQFSSRAEFNNDTDALQSSIITNSVFDETENIKILKRQKRAVNRRNRKRKQLKKGNVVMLQNAFDESKAQWSGPYIINEDPNNGVVTLITQAGIVVGTFDVKDVKKISQTFLSR